MADFIWPKRILTPSDKAVSFNPQNTGGGQAISGGEQVIGNSPGRASITLMGIRLKTKQQVKCWQALEGALEGRNKTILVPLFEYSRAPWPIVGGSPLMSYGDIPFDDGALFDDGAGFYQPVIDAVAASAVAEGAVTAEIQVNYGGEPDAGCHFGYGEYAARITQVLDVDNSGDAPVYTVKFRLPAREAIAAGDALDFDDPMIRCRLANDNGMDMQLAQWKFGNNPNVVFTEDV